MLSMTPGFCSNRNSHNLPMNKTFRRKLAITVKTETCKCVCKILYVALGLGFDFCTLGLEDSFFNSGERFTTIIYGTMPSRFSVFSEH